ncbi:MAG: lytic transglycosylase domain-containing protein [Bdellovibrionales bacterium]
MRGHYDIALVVGLVTAGAGAIGCAGPTSPFGAINNFKFYADYTPLRESKTPQSETKVIFEPERQVLHDKTQFSVLIEDPKGVPEEFSFQLTYNDLDVSEKFLGSASREYLDAEKTKLRLSSKNLRLLPGRDNRILASYQRTSEDKPLRVRYRPPRCNAFEREQLKSITGFPVDDETTQLITKLARERDLNPNFVAALIAQESSFNPKALSVNRALGLTQITPIGQTEILRRIPATLARYPGIDKMPLWKVKMDIMQGKINAENEWRLNPKQSVAGGIEYLEFLKEYWDRPQKQELLSRYAPGLKRRRADLLLASYNSGAARVSRAIETEGTRWLSSPDLREARKYVWRITSYCDHFNEVDK